ncbi:trichothecene efflux pump [Paraphaeosphaeria minitans]|uniref:Trichothecene efflux pump n=1 Tax=Paraphaeosphaeria minitans TaxID=565426 RepID=A0A9P6GGV1_9PLEO|nr:trichothecene efflux pump [Paraphaeosphaeria minitans]
MASTSPWDTTSPASGGGGQRTTQDVENLQKKRARDRKSQKAMRERTKWNIQCLTHQVEQLQRALGIETREKNDLYNKFLAMSEENDHLRIQKAALQLRLLGNGQSPPDSAPSPTDLAPYEAIPMNTTPTCMSDHILQTFVERRWEAYAFQTAGRLEYYPDKPDLSALFDGRPNRQIDETSSIVGDIVRSYTEIDTLPKKVAVHYIMSTLLKWEVLRSKASYQAIPEWLRPEQIQLERPHASWIDRVPWPKIRIYLIEHPEVKFDDFASAYSVSFGIKWDYDPNLVILTAGNDEHGNILINPIYEEHLRQLKNWTVGDNFRRKFPEMTGIIDSYAKEEKHAGGFPEEMLNPMPLPRYAI